jgi:hypothetical protein
MWPLGGGRGNAALSHLAVKSATRTLAPVRQLSEMGFRANDALRKCRRHNEKCPSNLLGCQAADFTQCERNLSLR